MQQVGFYLRDCVAQKLLEPSPIEGVWWTPSLAQAAARATARPGPMLQLGDFFVGSYAALKKAKAVANSLTPGVWAGSEIHHIVENFHLQFLGVTDPISSRTYEHNEPCVLLSKKHHDTHIDNIVGGAETLVLEVEGRCDFPAAFRADTPGISSRTMTEAARLRAEWVRTQERSHPPTVTRQQIQRWLVELYDFAYQEQELKPLRLIASAVLRGMPL